MLSSFLKQGDAMGFIEILPLLSLGLLCVVTLNRRFFVGGGYLNLQGVFKFEFKSQRTEDRSRLFL